MPNDNDTAAIESAFRGDERIVPVDEQRQQIGWDDIDWENDSIRFELPSPEDWYVEWSTFHQLWRVGSDKDGHHTYREHLDDAFAFALGEPQPAQ